jgi:hypothetical protein
MLKFNPRQTHSIRMPSKFHPRRLLPRLALVFLIFLGLTITLSVGLSESPPPLPDPSMEIQLPNGQTQTLSQILEAGLSQGETLQPVGGTANANTNTNGYGSATVDPADLALARGRSWLLSPDDRDPYRLGRELASKGNINGSIALLRSVPVNHPEYARSQRFLGWDLYTQELNQPRVGMHFIQQSIRRDPTSGNAWQDGYRALGHTVLPEAVAQYIR